MKRKRRRRTRRKRRSKEVGRREENEEVKDEEDVNEKENRQQAMHVKGAPVSPCMGCVRRRWDRKVLFKMAVIHI